MNTVVHGYGRNSARRSIVAAARFSKRMFGLALVGIVLSVLSLGQVQAQQADDFYLPFPESAALTFFDQINTATGTVLLTRTDIVVREDNTTIVFDDQSDGYESQYTNPVAWVGNTQLWGDMDCSNGFAPGTTCSTNADDVLTVGQVIILDQTQASSRDYFLASNVVNLTRSFWPQTPGTVLAGAFELFPTEQWGTTYVVPIGEDTVGDENLSFTGVEMFEQVAITVIA